MPIIINKNIDQKVFWCLWKIEETEEELLVKTFEDETSFEHIKNKHNRLQTIASRVALKDLLGTLQIEYKGIIKDGIGKPQLIDVGMSCSISHSKNYALVAVSKNSDNDAIGCDVEKIQARINRLLFRIATNDEIAFADANEVKGTKIWCIKEASYKAFGKLNIEYKSQIITHFEDNEPNQVIIKDVSENQNCYQLQFEQVEDTLLCFAFN
ncbi:4'-phosphopantetheinyl transferase superfamily protein [Flammeovirga sp. MY04]|uniref:4'-phosphopantetheinyl transferase family protein n=1 Tax=Flammeovirga sp. MY04 TaxID=1191459 RepID=UPI0008063ACB|nr:4'-phosphopantetheinyl transferase superfamily protein [Flammeovirga sp. MY04]ANQ48273.1 4'-phosphopantetheinyl transferase superfamily protein [Flammeovirga sp. MY04]